MKKVSYDETVQLQINANQSEILNLSYMGFEWRDMQAQRKEGKTQLSSKFYRSVL